MPRPRTTCSSAAPADRTANISHPLPHHDMHAAGPGACVAVFAPQLHEKRSVHLRISRGQPCALPAPGPASFVWHARCCTASRLIPLWAAAACPPPLSLGAFLRFIGSRLGLIASSSLASTSSSLLAWRTFASCLLFQSWLRVHPARGSPPGGRAHAFCSPAFSRSFRDPRIVIKPCLTISPGPRTPRVRFSAALLQIRVHSSAG